LTHVVKRGILSLYKGENMKKLKITRFSDPGHSWFKVPRKLLKQYDVESFISGCSYQLGEYVYLEEDCDFAVLMKAVTRASCLSWELITEFADIQEKWTNKTSKIRSYPRFIPNFNRLEWKEGQKVILYGKNYTMLQNLVIVNAAGQKFKVKPSQLDEMFLDLDTAMKELDALS